MDKGTDEYFNNEILDKMWDGINPPPDMRHQWSKTDFDRIDIRFIELIKWLETEIAWIEQNIEKRQTGRTDVASVLRVARKVTLHEVLDKVRQFNMDHV